MTEPATQSQTDQASQVESFAMSFAPLFAFVGLLALVGTSTILWVATKGKVAVSTIGWTALPILLGAFLFTLILVLLFRVQVKPEGLRSFDSWGFYETVSWDDFNEVHLVWVLGLRFLRVRSPRGAVVLLPLFLCDQQRLQESIERYAGKSHPLALKLKERRATPSSTAGR